MSEISVIIPKNDDENLMRSAIKIVMQQSFKDFEIIRENDFSETVSGKYIAIMHANYVMHVDRLKIQHATMEAEPSIAVCFSRVEQFANKKPVKGDKKLPTVAGLIENPLLDLLQGNFVIRPSAMVRKSFLNEHNLQCGIDAFRFWAEIAKHGGQFYADTQTLLYSSQAEIDIEDDGKNKQSSETVINEIIEFLVDTNGKNHPELRILLDNFRKLQNKEMMTQEEIVIGFFRSFFNKNKEHLCP